VAGTPSIISLIVTYIAWSETGVVGCICKSSLTPSPQSRGLRVSSELSAMAHAYTVLSPLNACSFLSGLVPPQDECLAGSWHCRAGVLGFPGFSCHSDTLEARSFSFFKFRVFGCAQVSGTSVVAFLSQPAKSENSFDLAGCALSAVVLEYPVHRCTRTHAR